MKTSKYKKTFVFSSIYEMRFCVMCFLVCGLIKSSAGVSTKLDFGEEESTFVNTTNNEDEDVEVKHTIVVSTKLKNNNNNNRRGFANGNHENSGALTFNVGSRRRDSEEVPIVPGYKAVDSTLIRTPDTRNKPKFYPESPIINRNIRDELDIFPNVAFNPQQWKPASFFNNINWNYPENPDPYRPKTYRPVYQHQTPGIHRKISDAGVREFYCKKCAELSNTNTNVNSPKGCLQARNNPWTETTTAKMKLDGKLAKLN